MIGDSFERDILPAAKAGIGHLVHIDRLSKQSEYDAAFGDKQINQGDFKNITWKDDQEEDHNSNMFVIKKLNSKLIYFLRDIVVNK